MSLGDHRGLGGTFSHGDYSECTWGTESRLRSESALADSGVAPAMQVVRPKVQGTQRVSSRAERQAISTCTGGRRQAERKRWDKVKEDKSNDDGSVAQLRVVEEAALYYLPGLQFTPLVRRLYLKIPIPPGPLCPGPS